MYFIGKKNTECRGLQSARNTGEKATIKNAVEVRSNDFALETAGELCMLVDHWKRKTRSLRCLSENKQTAKSKAPRIIKMPFHCC
ncbi:Uncharacterised protein [Escherichia coli]|uniref:Uncharacterized protein n=1 Tax=Escherichia coli TaxID=562 RepID=A0A377BAA0_ECOLX|nr:Uncharacterised protein [Escherichia coli]